MERLSDAKITQSYKLRTVKDEFARHDACSLSLTSTQHNCKSFSKTFVDLHQLVQRFVRPTGVGLPPSGSVRQLKAASRKDARRHWVPDPSLAKGSIEFRNQNLDLHHAELGTPVQTVQIRARVLYHWVA
jgi:hypothetical protein